ncbi:MAG: PQQ-dependent sugar dehydrogenase [Pseudomonadota bacterium]|nr:PQQ-dependent sugar dehydrogenase [Pseudomonadota bacterium]
MPIPQSRDSKIMRLLSLMLGALISLSCCLPAFAQRLGEFTSEKASFQVVVIATGLDHPWSMAFLPEGDFLVTERSGALRLIRKGRLQDQPIAGLPEISAKRDQGGLLDIALDPAFDQHGRLCLSYVAQAEGGRGTEIGCGIFRDDRLDEFKVIFRALPKNKSGRHFGCRLLFADGYLYATLGDRGNRPQAQDRGTHPGSVVRLMADGTVPADNPFIGHSTDQPELYAYGNRNPQGLAQDPITGAIWMHEHGPRGGDELNRLMAGANYGWPVISYGKEYFLPKAVGEGTHNSGMEQPVHYWVPSIAPSGMTVYSGPDFTGWRGSLFLGSLKFQELVRLELDQGRVVAEERFLSAEFGRIRDVRQGPDGALYLLTDAAEGQLLKLVPAE